MSDADKQFIRIPCERQAVPYRVSAENKIEEHNESNYHIPPTHTFCIIAKREGERGKKGRKTGAGRLHYGAGLLVPNADNACSECGQCLFPASGLLAGRCKKACQVKKADKNPFRRACREASASVFATSGGGFRSISNVRISLSCYV